jgi:hypothetical protein
VSAWTSTESPPFAFFEGLEWERHRKVASHSTLEECVLPIVVEAESTTTHADRDISLEFGREGGAGPSSDGVVL